MTQPVPSFRQGGVRPRNQQSNTNQLPDDVVEMVAAALDALADRNRIRVVERLAQGDARAEVLAARLDLEPDVVEAEVARLSTAGVVITREAGDRPLLRLADSASWWVIEQIAEAIFSTPGSHPCSGVGSALGPQDQTTTDPAISRPGDGGTVDDRCGGN